MESFTYVDEATITLSVELVVRSHVHAVIAVQRMLASPDIVICSDDDWELVDGLGKISLTQC